MNLVGQVLENRYKLHQPIGVGGMGTVYLAEHVLLGEECAVKVLSPRFAFDAEWVDRFLLEARAAIRIRHDNVVRIKDFAYPEPGLVYMVMEAISGESLSDLLRREGAVSWRRALKMADHIASALESAHACGIIHRDIKPSNCVRTTVRGDTDFVKVLDFGIAKFTASTDEGAHAPRTATGVWMGTAEYMAPEMYRGDPPDARVDIYALGVLIYKLITGEAPYQGSHIEVAVEQSQRAPTPPGQCAPERQIPASVDVLVLRALARDLESRTASMTALREEIAAVLAAPTEVSLVVDIEDYEPTVIRKVDPPTHCIPTSPDASTAEHSSPAASTIPPATAKPTGPHAVLLPAPARSTVAASSPRSPVRSSTHPVSPPRPVATQTEPRRAVSAGLLPVPTTEVTPSRRPAGWVPLATATLTGFLVLTVVAWRMTARTQSATAEAVNTPSELAATATQVHAPPAPLPPTPDAASPPTPALTVDDVIVIDEPQPTVRATSKPRPRKPPQAVDERPLAVTKKDVEGILHRVQRECAGWSVPRGSRATVDILIDSNGKATPRAVGMSDAFFVDCLNKKLKQAQFPRSQNGGTFRHDFLCC